MLPGAVDHPRMFIRRTQTRRAKDGSPYSVVEQIIPLTHRAFWSDYLPGETTDVVE